MTILATALEQLDKAAERLELDPQIYQHLRHPKRSLIVSVPFQTDAGDLEVLTGPGKRPGAQQGRSAITRTWTWTRSRPWRC
jgi:hypothetical protein